MMDYADLPSILACPRCKGAVRLEKESYICETCTSIFPFRFEIPDFRVKPDPYIGIEEEVAKISSILRGGNLSFDELVDSYYENTPEVSTRLQPRYKKGLKAGVDRAENFFEQMQAQIPVSGVPLLDIGCGTAGMTVVSQERYGETVGIDVALRWLVIGRQRMLEAGLRPCLLCANAEALPFRDHTFAGVVSDSTLEHVSRSEDMIQEAERVTRLRGFFFINTANRNSILEAYTGFPFAGLFPRELRWRLIGRVCQTPYRLNPLSVSELHKLFRFCSDLQIRAFRPLMETFTEASSVKKRFISLYQQLLNTKIGNRLLTHIGFFVSASGHFP